MSASTARRLAVAVAATATVAVPAAPAAAQGIPEIPSGISCRIVLPITVDDAGRPHKNGRGTATCNGRMDDTPIAGTDIATLERLVVAPAVGGGYMIRSAQAKITMNTAVNYQGRRKLRLDLAGVNRASTQNTQALAGMATDARGRALQVLGTSNRIDGVCQGAVRRRDCGIVVPGSLVFKVTLAEVPQVLPAPASAPLAGLL